MFINNNNKSDQIKMTNEANFDDEVYAYGELIYNTIIKKVFSVEEDDKNNYKNATLILDDFDLIEVPFDEEKPNLMFYITCPKNNTQINFSYRFNAHKNKSEMGIDLLYSNYFGNGVRYSVGWMKNPFRQEPNPKQKKFIKNSLIESLEKVQQAKYSKNITYSKDNYNERRKAVYYNDAMKYLKQIDPNRTVLPSVEYAVNSIISSYMFKNYPDKERLNALADILTKKAMERLKTGKEVYIFKNLGMFGEALKEVGIKDIQANRDITIGIDKVVFTDFSKTQVVWKDPILNNCEVLNNKESTDTLEKLVKRTCYRKL